MKRLALATLILFASVAGAYADHDVYTNVTKHPRGDDVLQADTSACTMMLGAPQNGVPTSRAYKSCMLSHGWRFSRTVRERTARSRPTDLYPDPDDPGMMCRSYTAGGISQRDCSNVW